jgi:hypothetical protein
MNYFKAIFYKEWIKLRIPAGILLLANLAFALYLCIKLRYVGNFNEGEKIWSGWIFNGYLFYTPYTFLPLVSAMIISFLQYNTEIQNKRIKLVFHLPVNEEKAILQHQFVGLLLLCAITLPCYILIAIYSSFYLPIEFLISFSYTICPWFLAAISGYIFTELFLLEGNRFYKVFIALLGLGFIRNLFYVEFYNTYLHLLLPIGIITTALFFTPLLASYRFRKGLSQ